MNKAMLKGKTILITGGGSGIGQALTNNLSADNKVIICGRNEDKLRKVVAANRNVRSYITDISVSDEIDKLFSKIAEDKIVVDVLINNAAVIEIWDIPNVALSTKRIFESINTNLTGAIAVTQKFISQASKTRENLIINVTSEIALFPIPILPLYATTKAALRTFTQSLRIQFKDTRFQVVEILPPTVDTAMPKQIGNAKNLMNPDTFAKSVISKINTGALEYAPGANVPMLKFFSKFLPNIGLGLVDKMSRKQLHIK